MTAPDIPEQTAAAEPVLFDAVLFPHRSLPPGAFVVLMIAVTGISFGAGVAFAVIGAWPVLGFFGLDVLLLAWFFHLSYRSGRLYETVRLTRERLIVRRVHPDGAARSWSFQPFWLRVEIDRPAPHTRQLALVSHGRRLAIGSFLTPEEKQGLATELRAALAQVRSLPTGGAVGRGPAEDQAARPSTSRMP